MKTKKGITGDMLFWFMILIVGAITVVIIAIFVTRIAGTLDKPPGESPLVQSAVPVFFWMFFKLRKQR